MNRLHNWYRKKCIKLSHWEYWNANLIYFPLLPYLLYLICKTRNFFFFHEVNPGIENGGFVMESKWKIYENSSGKFAPLTVLIDPQVKIEELEQKLTASFNFPLVAKPDIGGKGRGVAVLKNYSDWQHYHRSCPIPYLIQEKIDWPLEAGIFYVRMPYEKKGRITGIVQKEFIEVSGNGKDSVFSLLWQNPRYFLQMDVLEKLIPAEKLLEIPSNGEKILILDIGNHARGSAFRDVSYRINETLTEQIENICQHFEGFYFGRLDLRFSSWEALERGEEFSLIEINGSGSEPTHIFDPKHSIWFAWKEITRHWKLMQHISLYNRKSGFPKLQTKQGIKLLLAHKKTMKKLDKFVYQTVE